METGEDMAQAALSCRRFLEGLANILYPPRAGTVGNRKVGSAEYRNRLWAYAEERLDGADRDLALTLLDDLGRRIDALDRLSNKGIHDRLSRLSGHRLVVALVTLTYDLLALSTPPLISSWRPYAETIEEIARDVVEKHRKLED
jgi:hypothetical protein